jgi:hypothetical protein
MSGQGRPTYLTAAAPRYLLIQRPATSSDSPGRTQSANVPYPVSYNPDLPTYLLHPLQSAAPCHLRLAISGKQYVYILSSTLQPRCCPCCDNPYLPTCCTRLLRRLHQAATCIQDSEAGCHCIGCDELSLSVRPTQGMVPEEEGSLLLRLHASRPSHTEHCHTTTRCTTDSVGPARMGLKGKLQVCCREDMMVVMLRWDPCGSLFATHSGQCAGSCFLQSQCKSMKTCG